MKKSALFIMLCPVVLILLCGCRGSFSPPAEETPEPTETRPAERPAGDDRNPLGLEADLEIVPAGYAMAAASPDSLFGGVDSLSGGDEAPVSGGFYEAYRIQLFTSKEQGPAFKEMTVAREVFDREVTLDYEVPYYKVRVGEFPDRNRAEEYLGAAREAGYKNAWVVKVNRQVKAVEDMYDATTVPVIDSLEQMMMDSMKVDEALEYPQD